MTRLSRLLTRPSLPPRLRVLAFASASVAQGAWDDLAEAFAVARDGELGITRSDCEETLLQAVLFFGFPRCVTAFETLNRIWPTSASPEGGALPPADQRRAGRELFDAIYDRNAPAVHAMLRSLHAEFHDFVLEAAYGRVLTRPGLLALDRELLAVAALAALDQLPQLIAHGRGARRFGAAAEAIREAIVTAVDDAPGIDAWMQRIG